MSTDDQSSAPVPGTPPGTGPDDGRTPDEAYERVRDADPAASATPDLGAIAAKDATVRAHLGGAFGPVSTTTPGEPGAATGATSSGGEGDELDELAVHREKKRRRVPLAGAAAAAVAGVLAFGVGGYALGSAQGSGGGGSVATADAPIALQERAAGRQEAGAAAGSTALGAADAKMSSMPGFGGRTVFTSAGLGTEGTSAPAWAYDAAGTFSAETAAKVASALGVAGEPRQEYGAWTVGPNDGQGPTMSLQPDGTTSVSFNDPGKDPWSCGIVAVPGSDAATTEEQESDPQAACGQQDLGSAPAPDAAISSSKDVLGALGLDPAGYEYATESYDADGKILAVTASQVVDGQRTGVAWSLTYSGAGLSSLYGSLAPTVSIGDYAVVSPTAAVERLGDPRFGSPGIIAYARPGGSSTMLEGSTTDDVPVEPEVPTVPPTVGAGAAFSWPVDEVTITSARLGWAVHYQADGGAALVPSYELSDAEGSTWSVVAVADDELDFSPTR
ncbi:hypothetical protein ACFP63_07600 [Oerskovia jenensis]|uniref:Uncharacterized protein n=1 Tax=Oerskovia jenensis TaxID=162169 RepID=A0ABS2LII7_9CELL|nr:hypothetical protein [Oerskovia jenensis]MBM7479913.1 hypothetical protein [Oerskovia jenensis]